MAPALSLNVPLGQLEQVGEDVPVHEPVSWRPAPHSVVQAVQVPEPALLYVPLGQATQRPALVPEQPLRYVPAPQAAQAWHDPPDDPPHPDLYWPVGQVQGSQWPLNEVAGEGV